MKRKLEFELGGITPLITWGHYVGQLEDTYYFKILFFNFYWTTY
jgi:hypothetical protein